MNYDINQLKALADAVYGDAVLFRRKLHMNPELSEQEEQTAAAICEKLDALASWMPTCFLCISLCHSGLKP